MIFGQTRDEINGHGISGYYITRNCDIIPYCCYRWSNQEVTMVWTYSWGGGEDIHINLVDKPSGKRELGRLRRQWEDIKMGVKTTSSKSVNSIYVAQNYVKRWL
jgi:hypothetical protein